MLPWCRLLLFLSALGAHCVVCLKPCEFPHFLWKPLKDGVGQPRIWITEGKYDAQADEPSSQVEVAVQASTLEAKTSYESRCLDYTREGSTRACRHREHSYNASCLHQTEDGKFTIRKFEKGQYLFSCIKFVQRGVHIVQLWQAPPSRELDVDGLCRDSAMERVAWPWIVKEALEWTQCPQLLVGGFDFEIHDPFSKQRDCQDKWKPSRLEMDCVLGEGMILTFASSSCSPLKDRQTEIALQCMGHWVEHWEERDYIFLLAAEVNKTGQFIFRFSSAPPAFNVTANHVTTVQFYTSPIAPVERRGFPGVRNIQHLEFRLKRSQSGMCYDEGTGCEELVTKNKCDTGALLNATCKRSCGFCERLPYNEPECRFKGYEKNWLLFNDHRMDRISVERRGYLNVSPLGTSMSSLGEFLCKNRHWELRDYKVLSYYFNGCRPRYTCIRFEEDGHATAKMQLSKSLREDRSFDLCKFEDDPFPLGNLFRSATPKILWLDSKTKGKHCGGIHGVAEVSVRGEMEIDCPGSLSDWDVHSCQPQSRIRLEIRPECPDLSLKILASQDFQCVGHLHIGGGYSLLMTSTHEPETLRYTCWVIRTYPERMSHRPWRQAYMLDTAQCGSLENVDISKIVKSAKMTIQVHSDQVKLPCDWVSNGNHVTSNNKDSADRSPLRNQYVEPNTRGSANPQGEWAWTFIVTVSACLLHMLGVSAS